VSGSKRSASAASPAAPAGPLSSYDRIYAVVRRIPRGRVASYGQVARLAGLPRHARLVGYALHNLPGETRLPWHRVVAADGRIAKRAFPEDGLWQRDLLEKEGVTLVGGAVDMERFAWRPRESSGLSP
jgi:methylated-DNA-protein-cysteine methyltransferase-like protein